MDTNIIRSLIEYEFKNSDYDTIKRTNSANSSPDEQRTSHTGNTQISTSADVPPGDREIQEAQKKQATI